MLILNCIRVNAACVCALSIEYFIETFYYIDDRQDTQFN